MSASRSGVLYLAKPPCENPPPGACRWCGEPIVLVAGAHHAMRMREMHRGDQWEEGDRNCRREDAQSRCWSARDLVARRGDPACVDCGSTGPWEADHDVPLIDGGAHSPENIARRCVPCHTKKTSREARARALRRRADAAAVDDQLSIALD